VKERAMIEKSERGIIFKHNAALPLTSDDLTKPTLLALAALHRSHLFISCALDMNLPVTPGTSRPSASGFIAALFLHSKPLINIAPEPAIASGFIIALFLPAGSARPALSSTAPSHACRAFPFPGSQRIMTARSAILPHILSKL
jgi:hypothetical protein